jgi:hypothetical protein
VWRGGASQWWWLSDGGGAIGSSSSVAHGESFGQGEGRQSSQGGNTSSRRWRWLSVRVPHDGDDCVVADSDPSEVLRLGGKGGR